MEGMSELVEYFAATILKTDQVGITNECWNYWVKVVGEQDMYMVTSTFYFFILFFSFKNLALYSQVMLYIQIAGAHESYSDQLT